MSALKWVLVAAIALVVSGAVTVLIGLVRDPLLSPGRDLSALSPDQHRQIEDAHASAVRVQWIGATVGSIGFLSFLIAGALAATVRRSEFSR
jgi:hypothetical protein